MKRIFSIIKTYRFTCTNFMLFVNRYSLMRLIDDQIAYNESTYKV
jgi:hypothetical protein